MSYDLIQIQDRDKNVDKWNGDININMWGFDSEW